MELEAKQERKETIAFKCKICKRYIDLGKCGYHRMETGHKEFEAVYDDI